MEVELGHITQLKGTSPSENTQKPRGGVNREVELVTSLSLKELARLKTRKSRRRCEKREVELGSHAMSWTVVRFTCSQQLVPWTPSR